MIRMFRSEWLKIRRSVLRLLAIAGAALVLMLAQFLLKREDVFPWNQVMAIVSVVHAMLFLPLLTGVYAALICRYEHGGGGWKAMMAMPVTRTQIYVVKLAVVMLLLALTQLLLLAALLIYGVARDSGGPIPWQELFASFAGGWIACLPLAALQLLASSALQSFAAPLAINVILTLPNILVVNSSTYAPLDPWTQPMLAMIPRGGGVVDLSPERLYLVVLISFCAFFAAGWTYFSRRSA